MMKRVLFVLALVLASVPAQAQLHVDITHGQADPMPVAVTDLYSADGAGGQMGSQISKVVTDDLERSGLFRQVDPSSFTQTPQALQSGPRFADWKITGAQALVAGAVTMQGGKARVEFRLFDITTGQQIAGMAYTTTSENYRRIAHKIADVIYNRLTGEAGYFDTKIVYVAESGPATRRVKRLAIMDQDGYNHRFLTDGSSTGSDTALQPDASNEIAFMSFAGQQASRLRLQHRNRASAECWVIFPA